MSGYQDRHGGLGHDSAGQYTNQGRDRNANRNSRKPSSQRLRADDHGRRDQYSYPNPRSQYPQSRGPQGSCIGSTSSSSPQQNAPPGCDTQHLYPDPRPPQIPVWVRKGPPPQSIWDPPQYPDLSQQQQEHRQYARTVPNLHQSSQPRLSARTPQAAPVATAGLVALDPCDEELIEPMSKLAVQLATPQLKTQLPRRPGQGTRGMRVVVKANHFLVQLCNDKLQLHHYNVLIEPLVKGRATSRAVMQALVKLYQKSELGGVFPVYDGRADLYTARKLPFECQKFVVTLTDKDPHLKERVFTVELKHVGITDVSCLKKFLIGVLLDAPQDAIQVLDIVLREQLSNRKTIFPVGRSFFSDSFGWQALGNGLQSWRGFYQSLRPTQMGLSLNLEVCKYVSKPIGKDLNNAKLTDSDVAKIENNLKGLKVEVTHQGNVRRKYQISGLTRQATKDLIFTCDVDGMKTTCKVIDYFYTKYGHNIKYVNMPCLQIGNDPTNPKYLPMEVCKIVKGQRYRKKLNQSQINDLLRTPCQRPVERKNKILERVRDNNYREDQYAKDFGLTISEEPTTIELDYHNSTGDIKLEIEPEKGVWNMRNKKFVDGGKIKFWYCIFFVPGVRQDVAKIFCDNIVGMCRASGMEFEANSIYEPKVVQNDSWERILKSSYHDAISQNTPPELLIVILPDNNGSLYSDLKRICETDIGLLTQCCLMKNVRNPSPTYLANLALKINVKVGGKNTVLAAKTRNQVPIVHQRPTIVFGADVTHPSPGDNNNNPSIAAVVASQDWPDITTYAGAFKAQQPRQEIILNLEEMVREHLISFKKKTNLPQRIIFYRDGVGEGQFQQVRKNEITAIRSACEKLYEKDMPTITFIVVQKRHHTRFFLDCSKNNVAPGTVVDTKICHPVEFDFYLCSHAGIKGTSRPAHYHVLWDENGFTADELQNLTYNLCYTYARCTRSVSIVPPVYYAHHIAYRARLYLDSASSDSGSSAASSSMNHGETSSGTFKQLPELKENMKKVMFYC